MRLRDWAFGSSHGIRILELHGNLSATIRKIHLFHHEAQIRFGFSDGKVTALFTLSGRPSKKPDGLGAVAGPDSIFHVRISPRLVQLVIKCCDNVFPWPIEGNDPVRHLARIAMALR
jgi:hypothetical protein